MLKSTMEQSNGLNNFLIFLKLTFLFIPISCSEDLFLTSKLWNTMHRPDCVEPALKTTLKNLGVSYIDMYLIHWPMAYKEDGELFPTTEDGKVAFSDVDYLDTWKEMEKCADAGLTKSIGLSNFNAKQVDRVCAAARIQPAVNQVECHPYLTQKKLAKHCNAKNIFITAYSPLGSPDRPWAKADDPNLLEDAKVSICKFISIHTMG
jgi:aldehyde reductase